MTREECYQRLSSSTSWPQYQERYTYLWKHIPNSITRATSWKQIESWPHLMFELMVCYKGLWYWDSKGFIF